jgi:heat shock protein HslJ
MKHVLPLLAACLLASACQTIPPETQDQKDQTSYRALGTEPFWDLTIEHGTMFFDHGGEVTAKAKSYTARPSFNGWRYVANEMTVDVTFAECSDGMSEYSYKDSVIVMVGDRKYEGCGGGILPPDDMEKTSWRVVSINGAEVAREREAVVSFENGRMSGSIGCNRLGAEYGYKDKKLSFGPMMSTKMGCPDPIGAQEYAFGAVLGEVASTEFPGDATMVLTGKDGVKVVLQQLM